MAPITLLKQFGFARDKQHSFISTLSGGEKRRLQILSLLIANPNVMLCDELTNDLDVTTLSMLEELLAEFTGTLIMVSHDRMLLDRLVDHLIVVEGDGSVSFAEGKFTDYLAAKKEEELERRRQSQRAKKSRGGGRAAASAPMEKPVKEKKVKLSYKERKQYECLEGEIADAEARQEDLSRLLVEEAESAGYALLSEWTDELAKLEGEIASKSELWLELAERAEVLG
jgi:ABC transport system ATP-binding/permease protein